MKGLIKQDINFLQYPLWRVAKKENDSNIVIENEYGVYEVKVGDKFPNKVDITFLYILLKLVQKNNFKSELEINRYKLLKYANYPMTSYYTKRALDSLEVWSNVSIKFKGTFYENGHRGNYSTHILSYIYDKTDKSLRICFDEIFMNTLRKSNYFKYIDIEVYLKLKSPVALRLYEILSKSFFKREFYCINIFKLRDYLTLNVEFRSDILKLIKPAIKNINQNTDLKVKYSIKDDNINFRKLKYKPLEDISDQLNLEQFKRILKPEHQVNSVYKIIEKFLDKGEACIISNIKYVYSIPSVSNFGAYLKSALKSDYGEELRLKRQTERKEKNELAEKKKIIMKKILTQLATQKSRPSLSRGGGTLTAEDIDIENLKALLEKEAMEKKIDLRILIEQKLTNIFPVGKK